MTFANVMELFSKALKAGGGLVLVIGLINLAFGVKDHEGSKVQNAIWTAVAGGVLLLAAAMVTNITL